MGGTILWDAGSNKVKDAELSSSIYLALLPDCGYNGQAATRMAPH